MAELMLPGEFSCVIKMLIINLTQGLNPANPMQKPAPLQKPPSAVYARCSPSDSISLSLPGTF